MNFEESLNWLYSFKQYGSKLGLERISYLVKQLENPQNNFKIIHVTGTNGKGSTAIILQNILMQHGLKVGLFTSPHLVSFNERIRINDDLIGDQFIIDFWKNIKEPIGRFGSFNPALVLWIAFDKRVIT